MSIKIIKKILILSLFYFTFGVLSAEEDLKSVGKFKDWESFILSQDENKVINKIFFTDMDLGTFFEFHLFF